MTKLVGIKIVTTKSGKTGYAYQFMSDFTDYDTTHAQCIGNQVFSEYSSQAFQVKVGDEVEIVYGKGFQGKAQLMDIRTVLDSKIKINK